MGKGKKKEKKAKGGIAAAAGRVADSAEFEAAARLSPELEEARRANTTSAVASAVQKLRNALRERPSTGPDDIKSIVEWARSVNDGLERLSSVQREFRRIDGEMPLEARAKRLKQWMRLQDWEENVPVEIKETPDAGLGLYAGDMVESGAAVMKVPLRAMITQLNARASALAPLVVFDPILSSMESTCVAVYLLSEHCLSEHVRSEEVEEEAMVDEIPAFGSPEREEMLGSARFRHHRAYLSVLPEAGSMGTMLSLSIEEALELLPSRCALEALTFRATAALHYCEMYQAHCIREGPGAVMFERIQSQLESKEQKVGMEQARRLLGACLTWEGFKWAMEALMSRQNSIPLQKAQPAVALIPMWDMINHEDGAMTTDWDDENRRLVHYAKRSFDAGEEIKMCYGPRGNEELLLYAGFSIPDNPYSGFRLDLELPSTDPLLKARGMLLRRAGVPCHLKPGPEGPEPDFSAYPILLQVGSPHPLPSHAFLIARAAILSKEDILAALQRSPAPDKGRATGGGKDEPILPLDPTTEPAALDFLHSSIAESLAAFSSTTDIPDPNPRQQLVQTEKMILQRASQYIQTLQHALRQEQDPTLRPS